jgi:hypothetical protein
MVYIGILLIMRWESSMRLKHIVLVACLGMVAGCGSEVDEATQKANKLVEERQADNKAKTQTGSRPSPAVGKVALADPNSSPKGKEANFRATANADLDCDNIQSTFQRIAFGDEQANFAECALHGAPAMFVDQETKKGSGPFAKANPAKKLTPKMPAGLIGATCKRGLSGREPAFLCRVKVNTDYHDVTFTAPKAHVHCRLPDCGNASLSKMPFSETPRKTSQPGITSTCVDIREFVHIGMMLCEQVMTGNSMPNHSLSYTIEGQHYFHHFLHRIQ